MIVRHPYYEMNHVARTLSHLMVVPLAEVESNVCLFTALFRYDSLSGRKGNDSRSGRRRTI